MGQPGAASVIWHGQNKCFSPALSEAVGQPTLPAGVTYTARQNEPKILKAIPPRLVAFLRKTEGSHSGLAFCGTPVEHVCSRNRESCRKRLSKHYSWLKGDK